MDKSRKNAGKRAYRIELALKYTLFVFLLAVLLFPYLFMLLKSLMDIVDINAPVVRFFPTHVTLENYAVFGEYAGYFLNSFIVVIVNTIFVPLTSCLVAFPLARCRFR